MSIEIKGRDANSVFRSVKVTPAGELCVTSAGAGGPSSDTTAANQTAQIAEQQSTNTKLDTVISQTSDNATATNQTSLITEQQSTNTKLDSLIASGSTADSTAANQTTQITEAQSANATLETIRDAETVNVDWDYYDIAYVAAGNGIGEIQSITYFTGTAPAGTQVLQVSFTYDANSNITRVERV